MKTYIASFFDTRARLFPYVEKLKKAGHQIMSNWIFEPVTASFKGVSDGYRLACGIEDIADIKESGLFILDTIDVTERGGREVELGVALTSGIPVIRIGPVRNVFHPLAFKEFPNWDAAIVELENIHRRHT